VNKSPLILQIVCLLITGSSFPALAQTNSSPASTNLIILPEPIPDPLERINRGLWAVNEAAMKGVIKPTAKVYRTLMPPTFRIGISNVGRNLQYPRRALSNILQERWTGARDESYRFLCNSVLGMGGFLDVASEFRIPVSEADFGQTFGKWGWDPSFYLMLPLMGPSSDRDAVGGAVDSASNPIAYFSPYNYIPTGIVYNNLTDTVDGYVRRTDSEADAYSLLRYVYALQRNERPVDWTVEGEPHAPTMETMRFALFGVGDRHFPERGAKRIIRAPATGRDLPYNLWLQPKAAPMVYLLPGIGAHRLNSGALAVAELLYGHGYSVVTVSSAFNFEFIERALGADLPGYSPSDVQDLHKVLTQIDRELVRDYPARLGSRALTGYSLGAFHTLLLAAHAGNSPSLLQFDRFLSIDSPVRLMHGIGQLDSLYNAALEWPADERTARIDQLFSKVAALASGPLNSESELRLSSIESRFLIGLAFRLNLRDVLFTTQSRKNQGVLKQPLDKWKREPVYREIMNYSFTDYLHLFVEPYYKTRGIDLANQETLRTASDLRSFESAYRNMDKVRVIANEDDFLLAPEDVQWLSATFGSRARLFPRGGHLGNLAEAPVQEAILNALEGLGETTIGSNIVAATPKPRRAPVQSPRGYSARGSKMGF